MHPALLLVPLVVPSATRIQEKTGSPGRDDAAARRARAEALLGEGKPSDALGEAEVGLEFNPEHRDLLVLASEAAERAGRADEALSYARLALGVARRTPGRSAPLADLEKRASRLDPLKGKGEALLEEGAAAIFRIAEGCAARGHLGNALDLFGRCVGTKLGARASAQLERLHGDPKVAEAVLEGTLDLPPRLSDRSSLERAAKEDGDHFPWENAWQLRSPGYLLVTDVDRPTAEAISFGMERMHRAYREIFPRPEKKDARPPCTVRVYQTRSEYEETEKPPPEGGNGFYSRGGHLLATFDPRWEGRARSGLWQTLFREGFRAFAAKSLPSPLPVWLEEGGACAFEGARFHPDGWLDAGCLPEWRLRGARRSLDAGSPTLEEVVTFSGDGKRPEGLVDLSWALVHFLLQFEDERSQRVYRPLLVEYAETPRNGGKAGPLERFVGAFVKKARIARVSTIAEFDRQFRSWILVLDEMHSGPPAKADLLLEQARKERADGNGQAAIESCRFALRKRPNDPRVLSELAGAEADLRLREAALLHYRRAIEAHLREEHGASRPAEEENPVETCLARMRALDAPLADALRPALLQWRARAADAAREYAQAGFPREAIRLLDGARGLIGDPGELLALRIETARASKVDPRRWRRLRLGEGLDSWVGGYTQKEVPGGVLFDGTGESGQLYYRHPVREPYRLEATIHPIRTEPKSVFALVFGVNDETENLSFAVWGDGTTAAYRHADGGPEVLKPLSSISWDRKRPLRLSIEVSEEGAECRVDDRSVGRVPVSLKERRGGVGLGLQAADAEFRDLRIRE